MGCIQNNGIRALSPFSAADLLCHACIYGKQRQRQKGSQEGSEAEAETRTGTQARDLLTAAAAEVNAAQALDAAPDSYRGRSAGAGRVSICAAPNRRMKLQQQKAIPWDGLLLCFSFFALVQSRHENQGCAGALGLSARACAFSASTLCALSSSAWASGI
jgi:hypothetical protein